DLATTNVTLDPAVAIGDPARITVGWTVTNNGTGPGTTTTWDDAIIASKSGVAGSFDNIILGTNSHTGALAVGASYSEIQSLLLPPAFTGRYHLLVETDSGNQVFENGNKANNAAEAPTLLDAMPIPYADLTVQSLYVAPSGLSGQLLHVAWQV